MIDLETEIRRTVYEWAEQAPMPPTVGQLADGVAPRPSRRPSRVLVAAALVVLVLAIGVVVVVRSRSESTEVRSVSGPNSVTVDDVAGQELAAKFGLATPPAPFVLTGEFGRVEALAAADAPLPTGPLGPFYAQAFDSGGLGGDPQQSMAVASVLPVEQGDVVLAAAGQSDGTAVSVHGRPGVAVAAWSTEDSSVVTWLQDGVAVVVAGPATMAMADLLDVARGVAPVDDAPLLPAAPSIFDPTKGPVQTWSWSMAPVPPVPVLTGTSMNLTAWGELHQFGAMTRVLSTVLDHGTTPLGRYTIRAAGHPEAGARMAQGGLASKLDGTIMWEPSAVTVSTRPIVASDQDVVEGMGPTTIRRIHLVLSDGRSFEGETYDVGRGWPVRVFVIPVPVIHGDPTATGLHVVRMEAYGAAGELLNAGPSTLGNGPDGGMAGDVSILPCHPGDPSVFVFSEYCQGG